MASFERARRFSNTDPRRLRGIGLTASLATNRPKKGPHRIHAAWQSAERTVVTSCELAKGARTRAEEEAIAARLALGAVAEACGLAAECREWAIAELRGAAGGEEVQRLEKLAPPEWTELLLGNRLGTLLGEKAPSGLPLSGKPIVFPGAFHPLHDGHERMAALAAQHFGLPVIWELSILNVDKPPLDFIEIEARLRPLSHRYVLLSRAATFVEKSALAPGCVFVVGADTIARIGDARYYAGDAARRDAAIAAIAARGCRFLVFGRSFGQEFHTLADVEIPAQLRALCDEVPESQFREDISSTQLRAEST
jgi:hypothetical protein